MCYEIHIHSHIHAIDGSLALGLSSTFPGGVSEGRRFAKGSQFDTVSDTFPKGVSEGRRFGTLTGCRFDTVSLVVSQSSFSSSFTLGRCRVRLQLPIHINKNFPCVGLGCSFLPIQIYIVSFRYKSTWFSLSADFCMLLHHLT